MQLSEAFPDILQTCSNTSKAVGWKGTHCTAAIVTVLRAGKLASVAMAALRISRSFSQHPQTVYSMSVNERVFFFATHENVWACASYLQLGRGDPCARVQTHEGLTGSHMSRISSKDAVWFFVCARHCEEQPSPKARASQVT
jgi:hypothetical protein